MENGAFHPELIPALKDPFGQVQLETLHSSLVKQVIRCPRPASGIGHQEITWLSYLLQSIVHDKGQARMTATAALAHDMKSAVHYIPNGNDCHAENATSRLSII